jgi:hypothetical protein
MSDPLFRTITSEDWVRELSRARKTENTVSTQIQQIIAKNMIQTFSPAPMMVAAPGHEGEFVKYEDYKRLVVRVAEMEDDLRLLQELHTAGVDNWDGYSDAWRAAHS